MTNIATKIAEEVFQTIERNGRVVLDDITEAVVKAIAVKQSADPKNDCVDPPMIVVKDAIRDDVALLPGGVKILDDDAPKIEVKRLSCAVFDDLTRAPVKPGYRDRFFNLSRWENKPDDVVVLWCKPFALFVDKNEGNRGINGKLPQLPRLYVVFYDEELDEMRMALVAWEAAKILHGPWHLNALGDALWRFRKEREAEMTGIAKDDPRLVAYLANAPSKRVSEC